MKLVTYRASVEAEARLGALVDGLVVDLARFGAASGLAVPASMLEFIDLGPQAVRQISALLAQAGNPFDDHRHGHHRAQEQRRYRPTSGLYDRK